MGGARGEGQGRQFCPEGAWGFSSFRHFAHVPAFLKTQWS